MGNFISRLWGSANKPSYTLAKSSLSLEVREDITPPRILPVEDLWPDVTEGQGEVLEPTWRPMSAPTLGLHGIGLLIATPKYGLPHLNRIVRWADQAIAMRRMSVREDMSPSILFYYLAHSARVADHREWLRASLISTHVIRVDDQGVPTGTGQSVASIVAQANIGWMSGAMKSLDVVFRLSR